MFGHPPQLGILPLRPYFRAEVFDTLIKSGSPHYDARARLPPLPWEKLGANKGTCVFMMCWLFFLIFTGCLFD